MNANPRRRTLLAWVAGILALLATLLLVLAFAPVKTCPNRLNLEEREREPGSPETHLPSCRPCAGRGRIPLLKGLFLCKVCQGRGIERGWRGPITTPDRPCSWCEGRGSFYLRLP